MDIPKKCPTCGTWCQETMGLYAPVETVPATPERVEILVQANMSLAQAVEGLDAIYNAAKIFVNIPKGEPAASAFLALREAVKDYDNAG